MSTDPTSRDEWLKEKIKCYHDEKTKDLGQWDRYPPEKKPYFSLAILSHTVALFSLLLGEREEAIRQFRQAAEYYDLEIKQGSANMTSWGTPSGHAGTCMNLLNYAILSMDKSTIGNAANTAITIDDAFPKKHRGFALWYYYDRTLAYLLLGEKERALEIVDKVNFKPGKLKDLFTGYRLSLEGILRNDRALLLQGLDQLLKYHYWRYRGLVTGPGDELLCVGAMAQIQTARMNGISITQDDIEEKYRRFIAWNLFADA